MMLMWYLAIPFLIEVSIVTSSPARYSEKIRKNWDKKGIAYPGQNNKKAGETSQGQGKEQQTVPFPLSLVSQPFRQSIGPGAWGRTWFPDSEVKIGDKHSRENSAKRMQYNSELARESKRPRLVDWSPDQISSDHSLSSKDSEWKPSSEHEQLSLQSKSSSESDSAASVSPSKGLSGKALGLGKGSKSVIIDPEEVAVEDGEHSAGSMMRKLERHFKARSIRNKVLFKQAWAKPDFHFGLTSWQLAENVRRRAKVDGLTTKAFRRLAGMHVRSHAPPAYAAEYKFHASEMMKEDKRRNYRPPFQSIRKDPNSSALQSATSRDVSNVTREKEDKALMARIERKVLQYLKEKRLDYKTMTLMQLEFALRDFPYEGFNRGKIAVTRRINDLIKKWKRPSAVEWHQFNETRARIRDAKQKLDRDARKRKDQEANQGSLLLADRPTAHGRKRRKNHY